MNSSHTCIHTLSLYSDVFDSQVVTPLAVVVLVFKCDWFCLMSDRANSIDQREAFLRFDLYWPFVCLCRGV